MGKLKTRPIYFERECAITPFSKPDITARRIRLCREKNSEAYKNKERAHKTKENQNKGLSQLQ